MSEDGCIGITHLLWKTVSKSLVTCDSRCPNITQDSLPISATEDPISFRFANRGKEEGIFPLTLPEIANAQKADKHLHKLFKRGDEKSSEMEQQY